MNFILTPELTVLVSGLSILSGTGSYLQGVMDGRISSGCLRLSTELVTALTAGLFIAYLGHSQEWNEAATCALVILFSNNGADTVLLAKNAFKQYVRQRFGITNSKIN